MKADKFTEAEKDVIRSAANLYFLENLKLSHGQFVHPDGWKVTKSRKVVTVAFLDGESVVEQRHSKTILGLKRNLTLAFGQL